MYNKSVWDAYKRYINTFNTVGYESIHNDIKSRGMMKAQLYN